MIIKKIAFGNFNEAFIEDRIQNKVNIIFSNDNNKGKTLLIQGLMYSLGNDPIFPTGFDFNNYYFYSCIEINSKPYEFMRRNKTVIVRGTNLYLIFESLSELKYWICNNLFTLPKIIKNDEEKIVDLFLYYQLFFIGQDKRNTSNIQKSGFYNKKDFLNMLSSINGSYQEFSDDIDIEETRKKIKEKKLQINFIIKKMDFIHKNPRIASSTNSIADKQEHDEYKKQLNDINAKISKYKNQRSRETNRITKLNYLLSELNSLNRNIEVGKVKCAMCGSDRIIYTNGDMSFEVSNSDVKKRIIDSIHDQIRMKKDVIQELTNDINYEQEKQNMLLKIIPLDVQQLLAFSEEILSADQYSKQISILQSDIIQLENEIHSEEKKDSDLIEKNKIMMNSIITKMNTYYHKIDPDGNLSFQKLFTINDENYSGSEEQEFYFCKLLGLNDYFKHKFPIIIDSYRSGELSTLKEITMLDFYKKLNKQVILTSTLKTEEYDKLKYDSDKDLNTIDYSSHNNSKILQKEYKEIFSKILEDFNILDN